MERIIKLSDGIVILVIASVILGVANYLLERNIGAAFDAIYYSGLGFVAIFFSAGRKI